MSYLLPSVSDFIWLTVSTEPLLCAVLVNASWFVFWNPLEKEISLWLKNVCVSNTSSAYEGILQSIVLSCITGLNYRLWHFKGAFWYSCSSQTCSHDAPVAWWKRKEKGIWYQGCISEEQPIVSLHPVCNHKCSFLRAGVCSPTSTARSSANIGLVTFLCSKHCLSVSIAYWARVFPQPRAWIWDHII